MLIMAHPDDAEFGAGGLMTYWHRAGHPIKILCLTNGNAGHHQFNRSDLAARRFSEASQAAAQVGAELEIWPQDDGRLSPSVELREQLIAAIRAFAPTIIVTHRTADYHPDHRATAQLVKDSAYLLQVPAIAPQQPPLASKLARGCPLPGRRRRRRSLPWSAPLLAAPLCVPSRC